MWNVFISMNFRRYDTFLFFFRKHDMVDVYILCFQKWNNNMISTCTIRSSFCSCEIKEHFFTCTLYRCSRCHKIRLQGWNCYKYFLTLFTDNMQVQDCNITKFCRLIILVAARTWKRQRLQIYLPIRSSDYFLSQKYPWLLSQQKIL